MRKLHHFGIPVTNPVDGETHNDELHLFCTDVAASPNKIEFLPELVQTMPHIAYEVESMDEELKDAKLIYGPFIPVPGMTVAFIEEEGIPVKLDYFS